MYFWNLLNLWRKGIDCLTCFYIHFLGYGKIYIYIQNMEIIWCSYDYDLNPTFGILRIILRMICSSLPETWVEVVFKSNSKPIGTNTPYYLSLSLLVLGFWGVLMVSFTRFFQTWMVVVSWRTETWTWISKAWISKTWTFETWTFENLIFEMWTSET